MLLITSIAIISTPHLLIARISYFDFVLETAKPSPIVTLSSIFVNVETTASVLLRTTTWTGFTDGTCSVTRKLLWSYSFSFLFGSSIRSCLPSGNMSNDVNNCCFRTSVSSVSLFTVITSIVTIARPSVGCK